MRCSTLPDVVLRASSDTLARALPAAGQTVFDLRRALASRSLQPGGVCVSPSLRMDQRRRFQLLLLHFSETLAWAPAAAIETARPTVCGTCCSTVFACSFCERTRSLGASIPTAVWRMPLSSDWLTGSCNGTCKHTTLSPQDRAASPTSSSNSHFLEAWTWRRRRRPPGPGRRSSYRRKTQPELSRRSTRP